MALSNTHGWLVIATGNKSEMAVGYATIYGDMVGGFALLKDVFKTDVWRLSRHLNERAGRELIPVTTIERPPSAELREGQRDDQSLPPYAVLDPLLEAYVELDRSREELEEQFDPEIVDEDARARRPRRVQAPPGGPGREAAPTRLRPRLAHADHQSLARLAGHVGKGLDGAPVPHREGRRQRALRQRLHQLRSPLPVRDADVQLATGDRQLVRKVGGEVAERRDRRGRRRLRGTRQRPSSGRRRGTGSLRPRARARRRCGRRPGRRARSPRGLRRSARRQCPSPAASA